MLLCTSARNGERSHPASLLDELGEPDVRAAVLGVHLYTFSEPALRRLQQGLASSEVRGPERLPAGATRTVQHQVHVDLEHFRALLRGGVPPLSK